MATRSHIVVKDSVNNKEHFVYHHCDGYIEGVGKWLKEFIRDRYNPNEFTSDEFCKQIEDWDSSFEYEDHGIHGDEEFIYHVEIDNGNRNITVTVEEEHFEKDEEGKWKTWWKNVDEYKELFEK